MSGLKQSLTLSTQKEIKIKICTPRGTRTPTLVATELKSVVATSYTIGAFRHKKTPLYIFADEKGEIYY